MPIYINRERSHDHETKQRTKAQDKAEKYESLRGPFIDWAKQSGKNDDEIKAGLESLENLIEYWSEQAEQGEK